MIFLRQWLPNLKKAINMITLLVESVLHLNSSAMKQITRTLSIQSHHLSVLHLRLHSHPTTTILLVVL